MKDSYEQVVDGLRIENADLVERLKVADDMNTNMHSNLISKEHDVDMQNKELQHLTEKVLLVEEKFAQAEADRLRLNDELLASKEACEHLMKSNRELTQSQSDHEKAEQAKVAAAAALVAAVAT